jgi:hypothetical protein
MTPRDMSYGALIALPTITFILTFLPLADWLKVTLFCGSLGVIIGMFILIGIGRSTGAFVNHHSRRRRPYKGE